jgi:hypothetical protein
LCCGFPFGQYFLLRVKKKRLLVSVIKLFTAVIYEYSKKARVFVPGLAFQLSHMFAVNAKSLPREEHLKGASLV